MPEKEIIITGQDGDYLLIADTLKGYKSRIHKSLLAANELDVADGKTQISQTLYQAWFSEAMAEALQELYKLFCSHIPLFIEKQNDIMQNPRYYSIRSPLAFYDGMFVGSGGITLGEMILLWEKESAFSQPCDCGGQSVIYRFLGSPLSGSCSALCICRKCGIDSKTRRINFNNLWLTRRKYNPIEPVSNNPIAIKDLIAILEGRLEQDAGVDKDDFHSIPGDMTIRVGKQTVSNETFSKLLFSRSSSSSAGTI